MSYNRIMLDLETLGTKPGSIILSIGAVFFSSSLPEPLGPEFHSLINVHDSYTYDFKTDQATVDWWGKQSEEARQTFIAAAAIPPIAPRVFEALASFTGWVKANADINKVQMWGNGSDFDNVLISCYYDRVNEVTMKEDVGVATPVALERPWRYTNSRCYRTLKGLRPDVKLVRQGTFHNALDDAKSQALHAVAILKAMKLGDANEAALKYIKGSEAHTAAGFYE